MKRLFIAAIVAASILCCTIAASAATQPTESFDKTNCRAAFDVNNWAAATVYCQSYAQDNAVDAQYDHGNARIIDMIAESAAMLEVTLSYYAMGDTANGDINKSTGLQLVADIRGATTNEQYLSLCDKMEGTYNRIGQ